MAPKKGDAVRVIGLFITLVGSITVLADDGKANARLAGALVIAGYLGDTRWRTLMSRLFTWQAFAVIGASVLRLVLVGAIFWLAERRSNPLYRDAGPRKGI